MSGIYSISKFTMLDYPDHLACIVWMSGCNMRCQYCHNPQIVNGEEQISEQELKKFLRSRIGKLEAVVFSGGEATTYKKLPELIEFAKSLGFKVKLDTNGTNPKMLKELIDNELLDYVALDYKGFKDKFCDISGCNLWEKFRKSLKLLIDIQDKILFEVRTTWHTDLLSEQDIQLVIDDLHQNGYVNNYYLQKCNPSVGFTRLEESKNISTENISSQNIKVIIR